MELIFTPSDQPTQVEAQKPVKPHNKRLPPIPDYRNINNGQPFIPESQNEVKVEKVKE